MSEILEKFQYESWDEFVRHSKGGTIFHNSWYLLSLTDKLIIQVIRDKRGAIEAGLAITPFKFLGTMAARRPLWTPYSGPLIKSSCKKRYADKASEEKKYIKRLLAESPQFGMYDYELPPEYIDTMPYIWNGFDTSIGYTYQIKPDENKDWQDNMSSSHRRKLKKAQEILDKIGGSLDTSNDFEECYKLIQQTYQLKNYKLSVKLDKLKRWWQTILDHNAGSIYVARDANGDPICTSLVVYDHLCVYYLASGIRLYDRKGSNTMLSRLLFNRMIKDAHRRGLTFDFEGSVFQGVEHFFRGWGGQCVPKYRVVKILRPWTYAAWSLHSYWTKHRKSL